MEKIDKLLNDAKKVLSIKKSDTNYFDNANLFFILKMENREVSAHSAFLQYILKPFSCNGCVDDTHLRLFIEDVLQIKVANKAVDIIRECYAGEYGRIDFLIWMDNEPIAVELKIWAGEQETQLERYRNFLITNGGNGKNVFYLTPKKRLSKTYTDAINITLQQDVAKWLDKIYKLRIKEGYSDYCVMLKQYKEVINRLTKEYMEDERVLGIIKSAEDFAAVELIENAKKMFLNKFLCDFFELLNKDFPQILLNGYPSAISYNYDYSHTAIMDYYNRKTWPSIVFQVRLSSKQREKFRLKKEHSLLFFVEIENNMYAGFAIRSTGGEGQCLHLSEDDLIFYKSIFKQPFCEKITPTLLNWRFVLNEKINFKIQNESYKKLIASNEQDRIANTNIKMSKYENIKNQIPIMYKELWEELCENII